jgi:hypothetical protein
MAFGGSTVSDACQGVVDIGLPPEQLAFIAERVIMASFEMQPDARHLVFTLIGRLLVDKILSVASVTEVSTLVVPSCPLCNSLFMNRFSCNGFTQALAAIVAARADVVVDIPLLSFCVAAFLAHLMSMGCMDYKTAFGVFAGGQHEEMFFEVLSMVRDSMGQERSADSLACSSCETIDLIETCAV